MLALGLVVRISKSGRGVHKRGCPTITVLLFRTGGPVLFCTGCPVLGLSSLLLALTDLGRKCCSQGLTLQSLFLNGLEDTANPVQ